MGFNSGFKGLINLIVLAKITNRQDIKTCICIEEETVLGHSE